MYIQKACGYVLPYDKLSSVSKSLPALPEVNGSYHKRWPAFLFVQKSAAPDWIQWTHHPEGKTHCDVVLKAGRLLVSGKQVAHVAASSFLSLYFRPN